MIKSELVQRLAQANPHLYQRDVERIVGTIFEEIAQALANGDRKPISGFANASTEIYRIARSLSVFRDGIVEKEKMEEAAAEERAQRRAVQDKAVDALGTGPARLSEGELTAHMSDELGEGSGRLRIDFNRTLDTLNDTFGQVINTSSSIRNGASEISQASQDLSHRTESQAATLEETAAALDEMTASVTSARWWNVVTACRSSASPPIPMMTPRARKTIGIVMPNDPSRSEYMQ